MQGIGGNLLRKSGGRELVLSLAMEGLWSEACAGVGPLVRGKSLDARAGLFVKKRTEPFLRALRATQQVSQPFAGARVTRQVCAV